MEIYLIRHTRPSVGKDICYGQSDLPLHTSFDKEAGNIKEILPETIQKVYSSPLIRCRRLAEYLFSGHEIDYLNGLKEIDCGEWELKGWNEIDEINLKLWMENFVNVSFPGGENFIQFYRRVIDVFVQIRKSVASPIVVIAHAGVIRSILAFVTNTPLELVFQKFKVEYGSVILLNMERFEARYEILR